jgi:hypothetical protein
MEKIYEFENGTIFVTLPESCDREKLVKITEDFLKKVISGRKENGNCDKSKNFREE